MVYIVSAAIVTMKRFFPYSKWVLRSCSAPAGNSQRYIVIVSAQPKIQTRLLYKQLNPFAEIQIYMFTRGVKINYITVWSNPTMPLLMFLVLPAEPHTLDLFLRGGSVRGSTSDMGAQDGAVLHQSSPDQARGEVSVFLPTSGLQASRDKWFEKRASLGSMLIQRRDLGIIAIIHEHNITEAVQGEYGGGSFPPPAC